MTRATTAIAQCEEYVSMSTILATYMYWTAPVIQVTEEMLKKAQDLVNTGGGLSVAVRASVQDGVELLLEVHAAKDLKASGRQAV